MHFVDELRLSAGASAPLVLKTDPGGKLIPIPGPQFQVDDTHMLLLGWSSYGGGMQTIHALLVQVDNGNVTLQRELMLTAARTASALIVRRDGPNQIRLGIGEPAARMLSERDWLLVFGPDSDQRLDIAQIRSTRIVAIFRNRAGRSDTAARPVQAANHKTLKNGKIAPVNYGSRVAKRGSIGAVQPFSLPIVYHDIRCQSAKPQRWPNAGRDVAHPVRYRKGWPLAAG